MSGRTKKESGRTYFELSQEKKKKLLGLFIITFSILLFLSIISFSPNDDPQLRNASVKALPTSNWLGIAGAYIAAFFVKSAFGYFSIVIPLLMGMWGFVLFKPLEIKRLIYITNFLLSSAFILAAFFGTLFSIELISGDTAIYFAGEMGKTIGKASHRLIGGIGAVSIYIVLMITVMVITFDLKIDKFFLFIADKGKDVVKSGVDKVKDKSATIAEKRKSAVDPLEKSQDRISKVIKGEKSTQPPIIVPELGDDLTPEPPKPKLVFSTSVKTNPDIVPQPPKVERAVPEVRNSTADYEIPAGDFLIKADESGHYAEEAELESKKVRLKEKLALFDIEIEKIETTAGPVVTLFEIVPSQSVRISKILSLENDIALALAAKGIRIIAPMPGRGTIGVEIPNDNPSIVLAGSVLPDLKNSKLSLPIALGKSISGQTYVDDLARVPHLLIAGATGSGKSVGVNMIIASLLFSKYPNEVKFAIIDPKKVELSVYETLKYHFLVKSPDLNEYIISSPQSAVILLKSVVLEMELRYDKLSHVGVRNIIDYNNKIKTGTIKPRDDIEVNHKFMPYIVVVIDELADLMITAGKDVEEPIARLAQMARAVGIHLVVATQRPSVDVITGVIKANFPARIAYQTAQRTDSRTILDMNGAEQLLGRGDMLYLPPGTPKPIRIQNAYITTDEIEKLIEVVSEQPYPDEVYQLPSLIDKKGQDSGLLNDLDPMFQDAAEAVVRSQQGSVSFIQRKLKVGYARAARIVDQLEAAGIVGAGEGSKAREILVESEDELETIIRNL
ncbi:MAG: DNA translocase FtsK [Ignavibacteriales bacterium]|jgi:S-DNA-T family DNA segregation ATPase FtsK/SpoIIIE|nr:DNA translocase FtsK [Ignavibacteriales bacterium]MBP7541975.1 DNA translocase FtsK [Ignavibacteriaceae bacterium]MBP9121658.1 DNA translocase FtsK [Ignavibacteriaceae bacterium]